MMSDDTDQDSYLLPRLQSHNKASNLLFNEMIKKKREGGEKIHHLGFGQSPFPVLKGAQETLAEYASEASYLQVAGIPQLREAVCRFHETFDDISHFSAEDVIIGPGTKHLIFLLMNVFNGDLLLVSPTWTTYRPQGLLAGRKIFAISTSVENNWKLTQQLMEEFVNKNDLSPNKLLIFCNPDNPTGTSYTSSELKNLSCFFRKHNIIVLSDEIYSRLHFENNHQSLAKFYPEGTILSCGISKWASAGGWRLGYHMYPKRLKVLRDAIEGGGSQTYTCVSSPVQYAALWLYNNKKETVEYVAHTRRILAVVAKYCHSCLQACGVKVCQSTAGFYMFPDFGEVLGEVLKNRGIYTSQDMCDNLLKTKSIALMGGGPAFLRPETELTVRLCFVDFDGAHALDASMKLGLHQPLTEDFVKSHCVRIYDGIQALVGWVQEMKAAGAPNGEGIQ